MTDAVERQHAGSDQFLAMMRRVWDDTAAKNRGVRPSEMHRAYAILFRDELDAAKQRIAEVEQALRRALEWHTAWQAAMDSWAKDVKKIETAHRTGFLECQRQAVEAAKKRTSKDTDWDTSYWNQCAEQIAQAISLLKPSEGDDEIVC